MDKLTRLTSRRDELRKTQGQALDLANEAIAAYALLRTGLISTHAILYPERHPRSVAPDHTFWQEHGEKDVADGAVFEWPGGGVATEWVGEALSQLLAGEGVTDRSNAHENVASWTERVRARLVDDNDSTADVDLLYGIYTALTGEEIPHPYDQSEERFVDEPGDMGSLGERRTS